LLTRFADQLPERLPPHVRHAGYVPLGRVLGHAAALVHHGGIGTAAAALAAGVPQLVMPLAHDQLDNGARLQRLGVGDVLAPERFDAVRVARRLRALLGSAAVAGRCRTLAGRLDDARPLDAAAAALEAYAGAPTLQAMGGAA
jgi:UDP:flavonoid glycosyltransferase YjiC (YdhE family)